MSYRSLRHLFCEFPHRYILSAHRLGLERRLVQAPGARNKLIYYTSIKQREHNHSCCQLCFEARFTSVASLLGVLTQPFYLLSKPNSPVESGKRGIRTPGTFPYFGFQDRRNRPLCHLSSEKACKGTAFFLYTQIFAHFFAHIIFFLYLCTRNE